MHLHLRTNSFTISIWKYWGWFKFVRFFMSLTFVYINILISKYHVFFYIYRQSWSIFQISYLLYTITGFSITIIASLLATIFTSSDLDKIDPILVAPFMRKYLKSNKKKSYNVQVQYFWLLKWLNSNSNINLKYKLNN